MMMAKEVSKKLAERVDAVVRYLLPNAKLTGNQFLVGNVAGESGKSLKIEAQGGKEGLWCDHATSQGGDLLELWCLSRSVGLAEAVRQAKQWLGVSEPAFAPKRPKSFSMPKRVQKPMLSGDARGYLADERKLSHEALSSFGVYSHGQSIAFPYWRDGKLLQVKSLGLTRPAGKKQIRVEANCEPSLFGWQALPTDARSVAITEGEIDAMTLHHYGIAALSVPFGGGVGDKHKWLEYDFDHLSVFDTIYLCLDQDDAGQAATNDLIDRLGRHRCLVVELPYKDANECLQNGVTKDEVHKCFDEAKSCDPVELKSAKSYCQEVIDEFHNKSKQAQGWLAPWSKVEGRFSFRQSELSIWTGTNGHGKSQVIGQVMLSMMKQGARVCVASLEMNPQRLLMRLTRQASAMLLPSAEYIEAIHDWYQDKLWMFDLVGTAKIERLMDVFLYAKQRYGIEVFVIDSLMKCGLMEDDYNAQKLFVEQLCDFKNQHSCHIHLIAHPRKSPDESKPPGKMDIKGSGAITDLTDNCFTVWRNKLKEDKVQKCLAKKETPDDELLGKCDCLLSCDKQRNGDWEGKIGLWFDKDSYQFLSYQSQIPVRYVDYSKYSEVTNVVQ